MPSKEENEKLNENEKLKEENKNENEDENENETENENEDEYENEYEYENEDDDETMDQNEIIKGLNYNLGEIIDQSKPFRDQIESLKKLEGLKEYWFMKDLDDKELKFKIFKLKLAHLSNIIDEKLFETIFDHTRIKLEDKLINTINKKENQKTVKLLKKVKINFQKQMILMIG